MRATALRPGEVATPILKQRPVEPSDEDKALMLQEAELGPMNYVPAPMK